MIEGSGFYSSINAPFLTTLSFNLVFKPNENFEIMLSISPVNVVEKVTTPEENSITNRYSYFETGILQPINLDVTLFPFKRALKSLGFEMCLMYLECYYEERNYIGADLTEDEIIDNPEAIDLRMSAWGQYFNVYFGLLYKLDLM
jgi:hypothetical protein